MAAPVAPSPSRFCRRSSSSPRSSTASRTRRTGPRSRRPSSTGTCTSESFPEIARAFLLNVKIFCIAEAFILVFALAARRAAQPARPGLLPDPRARDRLRRLLPRRADDPRDRPARLRRAGARDRGRPDLDDVLGDRLARPHLHGVRLRGLPRRDRVGAPEPGGGGALARAHARRRRSPRSCCRRRCGA